jgi:hypothetical protein
MRLHRVQASYGLNPVLGVDSFEENMQMGSGLLRNVQRFKGS